ncbi:aldehyde dehydrogenase [Burkholderia ubonensis]|nr:aldehyde dehydrogenase [Burkholderia ubonensis]
MSQLNNPVDVFQTRDPHTGAIVGNFRVSTPGEIAAACTGAKAAARQWATSTPTQRSTALMGIAQLMRTHADRLAELEARDTGKSPTSAAGEIAGAIQLWEYAASLARTDTAHAFPTSLRDGMALTLKAPVGVVGMIVPWNYPLITTSERLPFALAAGCCIVLKPSELAAGCLPFLVEQIQASGLLPAGTLQVLYGPGETAGQALCAHPDVDMIAFVGSTRVGRLIESAATAHGKRVASELGGNNFVLVYDDADLDAAARAVVEGGLRNGGQACVAGAHVLVAPQVAEPFLSRLQSCLVQDFPAGEHGDCPTIQPMITAAHRARIASLIELGIEEDLQPLRGSCPGGTGNRIGPVVFTGVPVTSSLLKEELFGPLITVSVVEDREFIDVANASGYGLAAYVWTASLARAMDATRALRAGRIWVNTDPDFWLPELPVGGFGRSGTGREMGPCALDTYSLSKSVMFS